MITPYFQLEAYTDEHGVRRRTRKRRSRSFVQGFLKLHFLLLDSASGTTVTLTDVDGNSKSPGASGADYQVTLSTISPGRGGAGTTYFGRLSTHSTIKGSKANNTGIQVGTGTTAVAPTDYVLATPISDGTSSGQLEYFPSAGGTFGTSGSTASFVLERLFRNSSGASITINEVGVYATAGYPAAASSPYSLSHVCIIRDVVSPGFALLNGEYARIIYTISVTA